MIEKDGIYNVTVIEGYDDKGAVHTSELWRQKVLGVDGPLVELQGEQDGARLIINLHSPFFVRAKRVSDTLPTLSIGGRRQTS